MAQKVSQAEMLRALGFVAIPSISVPQAIKALQPASYTVVLDPIPLTFATDSSGQSWMAKGAVALSDEGFNDTSNRVRKFREAAGLTEKSN
ncbi:MAG TPA: hypothetical protein VHO23_02530 [Candidatus Paceibacterota bacterium]|nr:hypothetical protein [Candidatus Paceibacterota bacterium]